MSTAYPADRYMLLRGALTLPRHVAERWAKEDDLTVFEVLPASDTDAVYDLLRLMKERADVAAAGKTFMDVRYKIYDLNLKIEEAFQRLSPELLGLL